MSILRRWYDGSLFPDEEIVPHDADYCSLCEKIEAEREYFKAQLSPKDQERFEDLDNLFFQSCSINCYANFAYGFKLGSMLMCEIFAGKDGPGMKE